MEVQRPMDDEINLMEYYSVLWRRKRLIITIVAVAVALSVVVSLFMNDVYQAKAVIAPAQPESQSGGASALLGSLGLAAPSSSINDVIALLNSNNIRERVIEKYHLLPIFASEGGLRRKVLMALGLRDAKTENEKLWGALKFLADNLIVTPNEATGVVQITMDFKDPKVATDVVNYTIAVLSDFMASETRRVALVNKKAMEEQLNSTSDPLIRVKIYDMISKQIEKTVTAEAKENAFFKVIDPPKVPVEKYKPNRALIVIASFVGSFFLAVIVALFLEVIAKNKSVLSKEDKRCS